MNDYPVTPAEYLAEGFRVFPVKQGEKTPKVEGWQTYDGPIAANLDNIGMVTGEPSGVIVLDVDANKGGWESLKKLEEKYGPVPETLRSVTGNGGAHFFFARPKDRPVRNGAGIYGLPGLDVRGDGGYVVVPPSTLSPDKAYQWDVGSPTTLAPLPEWVATHGEHGIKANEVGQDSTFPEGTRNDSLARIAGSLRHYGTPQDILEETLLDLNMVKCVPPLPKDEVLLIARSIGSKPQGHRPEAPTRPKAMSLRATEFLSLEIPPPSWLVQGVWPEECIGFIAGPAKSFKSFMALEMAYSIATGADFLGRFKVPVAQKVLLIQQESSRAAFQTRLSHMAKRMGDAPNLYIVSNRNMHIENEVDLEKLEAEIASIEPSLVILDPLRSFLKGDENSAQVVGEVVRNLRRIRDDLHTGVAVIHHTTKQNSREMSGSGALYGAAEAMMYVVRTEDREALKSRATLELKESDAPDPFYVMLDSETTALEIERNWQPETSEYEQQDHWSALRGD